MEMRPGLALLALALVASASTALAQRGHGGRPLSTTLTGAAEAPGPGDPNGSGTAFLRLNQGQGELCYELTWTDIEPPTAGHIHRAPAGMAGPVVVPLLPVVGPDCEQVPGAASCCVDVDPDLIKDIRQNPEKYYVNIHTASFPGGAIRGQLSK